MAAHLSAAGVFVAAARGSSTKRMTWINEDVLHTIYSFEKVDGVWRSVVTLKDPYTQYHQRRCQEEWEISEATQQALDQLTWDDKIWKR